eukprot:m.298020 g.298020  ORF g.298020 m.298020 type:complete len:370 (+) comp19534_c4_seq1:49-1158(+)
MVQGTDGAALAFGLILGLVLNLHLGRGPGRDTGVGVKVEVDVGNNHSTLPSALGLARFVIVVPCSYRDVSSAVDTIQKWPPPCQPVTTTVLLYLSDASLPSAAVVSELRSYFGGCATVVSPLVAQLTAKQKRSYPLGPSEMFYGLLVGEVGSGLRQQYDMMLWMELDVRPSQPHWLPVVERAASVLFLLDVWQAGSLHRGTTYDASPRRQASNQHVSLEHINGNGFYRVGDAASEWTALIHAARRRCLADDPTQGSRWTPFDTCLWQQLHAQHEQYPGLAHHFQHIGVVADIGPSPMAKAPAAWLVHGKPMSAGELYFHPCLAMEQQGGTCGKNTVCTDGTDSRGNPKAVCKCAEGFGSKDGRTCTVKL